MSDNVSLAEQTTCIDSESEDDWYNIDIFSHVQSEMDENNVSHKQIFLYVTRAGVDRKTFLQEEKIRIPLITVYSNNFSWRKTQGPGTLVAKLEMGSFQAVKKVDRRKIEEMRLPEKMTFSLPPSDASFMKVKAELIDESANEIILETEQLKVPLSLLPQSDTKPPVENELIILEPAESSVVTDELTIT
ncbi:unnamed protein product [Porites evermanni]|uniref:Uncharacterized protein n=1 Tax=Porites evermanni TaxID=104178 RepID=A0ABN8SH99_9CNID|nr:unnamed protein product [Porites evermanni]